MSCTCVFFHAHPDDEALLTAGTMALLAAAGHRVVLVLATAGEQGLADREFVGDRSLGQVRLQELRTSARALGCARTVLLGYRDSGLPGAGSQQLPEVPHGPETAGGVPFAQVPVQEAAARLAEVLVEERAELLTIYDPLGGYRHPDHVQVHRVGSLAATLAGTPVVLEATVDRDLLVRALRLLRLGYRFPPEFDLRQFESSFTPRAAITHRINVRPYARAKRASMSAHRSQTGGGDNQRTLAGLLRLPYPVFRWVLGTEWYVQQGLPGGTVFRHPLATLREC